MHLIRRRNRLLVTINPLAAKKKLAFTWHILKPQLSPLLFIWRAKIAGTSPKIGCKFAGYSDNLPNPPILQISRIVLSWLSSRFLRFFSKPLPRWAPRSTYPYISIIITMNVSLCVARLANCVLHKVVAHFKKLLHHPPRHPVLSKTPGTVGSDALPIGQFFYMII